MTLEEEKNRKIGSFYHSITATVYKKKLLFKHSDIYDIIYLTLKVT